NNKDSSSMFRQMQGCYYAAPAGRSGIACCFTSAGRPRKNRRFAGKTHPGSGRGQNRRIAQTDNRSRRREKRNSGKIRGPRCTASILAGANKGKNKNSGRFLQISRCHRAKCPQSSSGKIRRRNAVGKNR